MVSPADPRRRARRIALLLSAILIPTAAVILLVFRVVRQENELSERRASEQRREALDQLRRELTARLQALRLEEVNRLIGESGRRLPPDSPIVFVAPMVQDRMVLPWEDGRLPPPPSAEFVRWQREGESREFRRRRRRGCRVLPPRWTSRALTGNGARPASWLGRSYLKAGMMTDAESTDHAALQECGDVSGRRRPACHAAERLLAGGGIRPDGRTDGRWRTMCCAGPAHGNGARPTKRSSCSRCSAG